MARAPSWLLAGAALWTGGCALHAPAPGWLAGEPEAQAIQLERQLRGFDVAMMETGYRYGELYWAGHDRNWEAAAYHADKIRLAIENGLERRPKRARSARSFLEGPLVSIAQAVAARSPEAFAARFAELTAACNTCHATEQVPFFEVHAPKARISPVRRTAHPRGADVR